MTATQSIPNPAAGMITPRRKATDIIAVGSGKGGVGKTWFAVSLCHALANLGRKVLLFDGDLGLANVDVQLGLTPPHDLSTVLSGRCSLEGATHRFQAGGFDVIAGHSGSGSLALVSQPRLAELRRNFLGFSARYDHSIIDIGAGIDQTVQSFMAAAGTGLILTTDEPTALTDAYALIKVAARSGAADSLEIVVNMAPDRRQGEHTYQTLLRACENFLKISPPLAGIIRRDSHVNDSIRHQQSLLTRHPNCAAAEDLMAIAARIGTPT